MGGEVQTTVTGVDMTLSNIKDGGYFRIVAVHGAGEIRRRLIDMGFVKGAHGQVLRGVIKRPDRAALE